MIDRLDHVIIGVRDLDSATAAYQRLLGLAPSWRGSHPGAGTANTLFRLDNTYVELLAPVVAQADAGAEPAAEAGSDGELLAAWLDALAPASDLMRDAAAGAATATDSATDSATSSATGSAEPPDGGLLGLAFGTADAERCRALMAERGLEPAQVQPGGGTDAASGAERSWRSVRFPFTATRGVFLFAVEHTTPDRLLPRSAATHDPAGAVCALDHAVVRSTDAEGAIRLYRDALGLRLALDREFDDWGLRLLFFRVGGVTVEIACALANATDHAPDTPDASDAEDAVAADVDRLWGLSYRVPDVEAARTRLLAAGVDASEVRAGRRPGTRVVTVRDSTCGVPTLLLELTPEGGDR